MGRTLPNMLALPFGKIYIDDQLRLSNPSFVVNLALYLLLDRKSATRASTTRASWSVALLTFVAVVIRAEIAVLLGLFAIQLLSDGSLSITRLVRVGILSAGISIGVTLVSSVLIHAVLTRPDSIALTVSVDSYFWDHWPLWPEYFSTYFNVYEGKSAEWGVRALFVVGLSSHL